MAIATLASFKNSLIRQREFVAQTYGSQTSAAARFYDLFLVAPNFVSPSTAINPTSATDGAIKFTNPSSGQLSLVGLRASTTACGVYIFADRLSHQGGLSGLVTGAQTTNLPTASLTRFTSGEGVMIGLTIYAIVGSVATTITVSYTNSAGVAGRTTQSVAFGATGNREASRILILPLQDGDTGARSVESVSIVASTGTAGNFGVILFKPLIAVAIDSTDSENNAIGFLNGASAGGIPTIPNDACIFPISMNLGGSLQSAFSFQLTEN